MSKSKTAGMYYYQTHIIYNNSNINNIVAKLIDLYKSFNMSEKTKYNLWIVNKVHFFSIFGFEMEYNDFLGFFPTNA